MDEYQTKEFRNGAIRNPLILKDGGLSHTSVSTFFLRRLEQHAHGAQPRRPWLKWLIVVDVQQQILLAQRARQGPGQAVGRKSRAEARLFMGGLRGRRAGRKGGHYAERIRC